MPRAAAPPLRVLLTGFEPFGGEPVNPSRELVLALAGGASPHRRLQLCPEILPVDRTRLAATLARAIARHRPHAVVCVGQATGRPQVDLETLAHNCIDFRGQRDNAGHRAVGGMLFTGAPPRLPATLPLRALAATLAAQGLPVALSRDAGRHLCNAALFTLLLRHAALPAGFVHVPLLPEQAARRGLAEPSLPFAVSRRCLRELLHHLPAALAATPARAASAPPRRLRARA